MPLSDGTPGRRVPRVEVRLVDLARYASTLESAVPPVLHSEPQPDAPATDARSRDARLARAALRLLVRAIAGEAHAAQPLARTPAGKPMLPGSGLEISLSHSGGLALVAVSTAGAIGVDLECPRTVTLDGWRRPALEAAAAALSPAPLAGVAGTDARFLAAWVRLEALAKARGDGIAGLLHALEIREPARLALAARAALGGFRIDDLCLGGGLLGALALPADAPPAAVRPFTTTADGAG
ncbi:MAG: 4'-phosphopantetheinyl transferase superfamily protein [Hyphomicrobiaceae bacterium]